jgi:hypothetical protein
VLNDLKRPQYAELKHRPRLVAPGATLLLPHKARGYPLLATRLQAIFNRLQPLAHRLAGRFRPNRSHPVIGDT